MGKADIQDSKPASKGGRPTKYRPEMCEKVIEVMKDGASLNSVACALGVLPDALYHWKRKYPEFSEAIKIGESLSKDWWEQRARDHLVEYKDGPKLNTALWFINMKNRFGWRDKIDVHHNTIRIEIAQVGSIVDTIDLSTDNIIDGEIILDDSTKGRPEIARLSGVINAGD
ncbi:MAG: hypothetical protein KBC72_00495 [Acinetobacter sp.]|nr:hypothetical protein [Acinetobacter sp.]